MIAQSLPADVQQNIYIRIKYSQEPGIMIEQPLIVWMDRYSIGHKELDEHHFQMMTIINRLHKFKMSRSLYKNARSLLREAVDYSKRHFEAEETAMHRSMYPELTEHIMAHRRYNKTLSRLIQEYEVDPTNISEEFLKFLKGWWLNHIQTLDIEFGTFLKRRKNPQ